MTRRPRPAAGPASVAKRARPRGVDFLSAHANTHVRGTRRDDKSANKDSESGDEEDADAPRVAQWIDDQDFGLQDSDSTASDSQGTDEDVGGQGASGSGPLQRLRLLEDDLSTLPLGALRSAQRSLAHARALRDSESDSEEQFNHDLSTSEDHARPAKLGKDKDQPSTPRTDMTKRANKHAPVEVTSKRPVTRRRVVVDDALPKPRDPRFMHAAGRYDPSKFKQQYDFLPSLRNDELSTLGQHVTRAKKLLANSPSHLRAEREEELERLEHAVKRAESAVNLDNRERIESKALQSAKQAEREKRKQGKAGWWMRRSERKALLAKARLDAIASVGGRQAVRKAMEKKQKKISQKEKKMRPFESRVDGKRQRPTSAEAGGAKRRKVA